MKNLRLIEIELSSFCNRKCSWCPNKEIERTINYELDNNILKNLIQTLKKYNYSNYISFSRYNEPFAFYNFQVILQYIKQELPKAILVTNTNGDFLQEEKLKYIDELSIMDYDNKGIEQCILKLQKLNCIIDKIQDPYIYAHYKNMKILYFTNWQKYCIINNRGGNLPQYNTLIRNVPCYEPQYFIGINYDGTVSPCCQIRNDCKNQQSYIIGDLKYQSLEEILNSIKRQSFIKKCKKNNFNKNSLCYYCLKPEGRYTRDKGGINYE